jgi:hypothetical protein
VKKTLTFDESLAYAQGTITSDGTVADDGDTITIGSKTYTFKTALSDPAVVNEVLIGASAAAMLDNLKAAVNGAAGEGTLYSTGTTANAQAQATTNTDTTQLIVALTIGEAGNSVVFTESAAHTTVSGSGTLTGGGANELTEAIGGEGGMCSAIIINAPDFTGSITMTVSILDADSDLLFESTPVNENAVTRIVVEQVLMPDDIIKIVASGEVEESLDLEVSIR